MRYGAVASETVLYRMPIVALDFETTGLAAQRGDRVCEVGLVAAEGDRAEIVLSSYVDPKRPLSQRTLEITGIDERELVDAPDLASLLPQMLQRIGGAPIVMHNAPFDLYFLLEQIRESGMEAPANLAIDTLLMARFLDRNREGNSLRQTAERYGIRRARAHRAADDAMATALAFHALVPYLELRGVRTVEDLVAGRMAGAAERFVERPSSMLLDLVSRAVALEINVEILYARSPGAPPQARRVRARALEDESYLIGWDLEQEAERTFRLDRILALATDESSYMSPWITIDELPERFRK